MKKKGFTLIELIGVVIILGVVALIATPAIRKLTSNSKDELYNVQINNIKDGLKNWAIDNSNILPKNEGDVITLTLGQLKIGGYIDAEIKNPKNNKCFGNNMILEITRYQKNYIYTVKDTTGQETNDCGDYKKPYMILRGSAVTYVEINEPYIENGVIAKDVSGNDFTDSVVTTITGSGNTVDTSKIGNKYTITYSITIDDETIEINRTVIVRDSVAPILNVPENVVIAKSETSFDMMEGVSASDNSGENINVTTEGSINFGIIGKYTITYTATDSSGNKTTKKRVITINRFINGLMLSDSNCITDSTMICPNGTLVSVQVNATQTYDFYVIKDTGSKLTLLLDRNLGDRLAWINGNDYSSAGGTAENWNNCLQNIYGPITALKALQERTSSWTNLPQMLITTFDYDDGTEQSLGNNIKFQTYARLPKYSEISILLDDNNLLPEYVYVNLRGYGGVDDGYWLSTASTSSNNSCGIYGGAWNVDEQQTMFRDGVFLDTNDSIRPVIELSK